MATWVQDGSNGNGTAVSLAVTLNGVAAGNILIATIRIGATGRTVTVSDNVNAGNYTQAVTVNQATDVHQNAIYYKENTAAGNTTITLSISGANARLGLTVREYSGIATSASLDQTASNTGADASMECGSVTMTADGVIITNNGLQGTQTITLDTDYAQLEASTGAGNAGRLGSAHRITAAITDQAIHTASAANNWSATTAVFKDAAGGPVVGSSTLLGVATIIPTFTAIVYEQSTMQAVATVTPTWVSLVLAESTVQGVASITANGEATGGTVVEGFATLEGLATITADGEAFTEPVPARIVSGGMVGIPRNPPWDWYRKPKKEEDEEEEELVTAGASGFDPLLLAILAIDDD